MSLLASRAERICDDLRRQFLIPSDVREAAEIISELAAVVVEMSREIEELTAPKDEDEPKGLAARKLAADLLAAQFENHALKHRIRELVALAPKQRPTHHAVDNLGSSSSLEALVGCGSSYRGKTQIGVGSYRAKMHGVNS